MPSFITYIYIEISLLLYQLFWNLIGEELWQVKEIQYHIFFPSSKYTLTVSYIYLDVVSQASWIKNVFVCAGIRNLPIHAWTLTESWVRRMIVFFLLEYKIEDFFSLICILCAFVFFILKRDAPSDCTVNFYKDLMTYTESENADILSHN